MVQEWMIDLLIELSDLKYAGIVIGLMIEVIPSEVVLAYGGYLVSIDKINFVGAVIAGTIGGVIAQWFIYWLGYFGGRPVIMKYGKYLLIKEHHVTMAERWFERYGVSVIFSARFIPVVRHAISIPAGMAKMPFGQFTFYTALAVIPWSIFFIYLGLKLGEHFKHVQSIAAPFVNMLAFLIMMSGFLFIIFVLIIKKRKRTF